LIDFLAHFWTLLKLLLSWVLDGSLTVLKTFLYVFFDGLFTLVSVLFHALDIGSMGLSFAAWWGAIPSQAAYILSVLSIGTCISIIVYAIVIRMVINLIPSWITRI
jgi:hypothetical protein